MIQLQSLRKGDRVRITYENGRMFFGTFVVLLNGEFKGARFNIEGAPISIMVAEVTAGWVTIERDVR